jgi:hypothetical protein
MEMGVLFIEARGGVGEVRRDEGNGTNFSL